MRVIATLPEKYAVQAMERRYKKGLWHTCALDVADDNDGLSDSDLCTLLGEKPHGLTADIQEIVESSRLDWLLRELVKEET